MEKDFKEAIDKSTKAMKELEEKVEDIAGELSESASKLWSDFKLNFADIDIKLNKASENISKVGDETTLEAHLGAMEARDKVEKMKANVEEFTGKISKDAQAAFDEATLQAHLGKMEAEDFWEERGKKLAEESTETIEKMAVEAIDEITNFFGKLVEEFNDKKKS